MIGGAAFGIFDVSNRNANVTLEYGIARGLNSDAFIAHNPDKTDLGDVPSDVRGYDQLRYKTLEELTSNVSTLVAQVLGTSTPKENDPLGEITKELFACLEANPGQTVTQISRGVGQRVDLIRLLISRNESRFDTEGQTKGMRYRLKGSHS